MFENDMTQSLAKYKDLSRCIALEDLSNFFINSSKLYFWYLKYIFKVSYVQYFVYEREVCRDIIFNIKYKECNWTDFFFLIKCIQSKIGDKLLILARYKNIHSYITDKKVRWRKYRRLPDI